MKQLFQKGHKINLGNKHSEETKRKIGLTMLGKKASLETKEKMSLISKNRQYSSETRKKMSESAKKRGTIWLVGRKLSMETRNKMSITRKNSNYRGENHHRWIKDRTKLIICELKKYNSEYKKWMLIIKSRDNYKCKINNQDCKGRLEAHHILGYTKFPELRYDVNNGITLCHFHHPKVREEEKRLIPTFKELVSVSNEKICLNKEIKKLWN